MKITAAALVLAAAAATPTLARPSAPPPLKLEKVVMLMRHGIRPPTKANPVPPGYTADKWPSWPVDFGLLTPRGAAGVKLLGEADGAYYRARGLLPATCPAPNTVVLKASSKPRAYRTAESWAAGFMPDCPASVSHPGDQDPDPIFHGLDDQPTWFNGQRAFAQSLAQRRGGVASETRAHRGELQLLARVLGCKQPSCPLLTQPSTLVAAPHDRPDLEGPLDIGSTASQTLLLEYLEGMPMSDVGWGRVSRAEIEQLLRFHPLKFRYSNRTDYVARAAGAPLAQEIIAALDSPSAQKLTLLAGHDTNIADLGGFLQLHWHVPSYPADDVPPGSALGIELLRDGSGARYVRTFYRAQTMDQLREQRSLTGAEKPFRQYLPIPGCGNSAAARACRWTAFKQLVEIRKLH